MIKMFLEKYYFLKYWVLLMYLYFYRYVLRGNSIIHRNDFRQKRNQDFSLRESKKNDRKYFPVVSYFISLKEKRKTKPIMSQSEIMSWTNETI